ncbi:glycoside hydrolase family 3 N-terminal domain-containing protein [Deinococcus aestuarii]|uniref:glycoside hydrolase family 3 N-terminal domain-containing protein n=1 Tax=Deinococcus aestuarii TaxID=2774531 RepID=UPI001C0C9887|nr:glycoside hydrolase family 3 protein [Deinococcus aestuarii]
MTGAARTLIVDVPGPDLTPAQGRFLREYGFGGVCLFARNIRTPEQTARLIRDLRDALGGGAWIATDQEGGAVLRRLDVPLPPAPLALGVIGSEDAAWEAGAVAARGLIELGINWDFAPSLDVNVNPANPVIGERAFGANPDLVARLGTAWALGLEAQGVMAAVKHFPGHGDTHQDSHLTLPVVDKPLAALEATEWLPFRTAVTAGVGSVMTAHIVYPALDPHRPATLSPALLTGLLRERWGYGGVVVTDATDMRAIADRSPHGAAAPLALAAGADAVLSCGHGELRIHAEHARALEAALREGSLDEARVEEAGSRLERAARRFPGTPRPYTADEREADEASVARWAREALTFLGDVPRLSPDGPVLLYAPRTAPVGGPYGDAPSGEALADALRTHFPRLRVALHGAGAREPDPSLLRTFPDAPVILATLDRWAPPAWQAQLAPTLHGRTAVHLALWTVHRFGDAALPTLAAHGFREVNLRAAARALARD